MPLLLALAVLFCCPAAADEATGRPTMRQFSAGGSLANPPSARDLVDARAELKARFREPLAHTETTAGALMAAETFMEAAVTEDGKPLKWLLLDEARRLGAAAGNADMIKRAIAIQSAAFEFDEIEAELASLGQVPLLALDPRRATLMAMAAEALADRAWADGRSDMATDAQHLAIRSWERAGNRAAAYAAAAKLAGPR
jgi:hypothetical protein